MNMNQPRTTPSGSNNTQRNAIIIVVVLAVVVLGAILLGSRGNDNNATNTNDNPQNIATQERPPGANQADPTTFAGEGIALGEFVSGTALDRDSCVTQTTSSFSPDDTIYVGLLNSQVPANTPVFVRLYQNGTAVEDTDEVSSPEDFEGCLWFQFGATANAEVLDAGDYEAEIFVNSRPADTISFSVR